jgi:transcriptional regulator with XRE-family HTH domain
MARQRRKREIQEYVTADQVVAGAVRTLRKRRGITQQELADALGWPQSTIARVELGERSIGVSDLLALAWALDVAPGYLLAGSFQDADVPVHKTLRVPPEHMLAWIRGFEPLPGLDYRRFVENMPDRDWFEQLRPGAGERRAAGWEHAEELLASGAVEQAPGREARLSPERRQELAKERAARRKQLDATRRAGKRKEKSE